MRLGVVVRSARVVMAEENLRKVLNVLQQAEIVETRSPRTQGTYTPQARAADRSSSR